MSKPNLSLFLALGLAGALAHGAEPTAEPAEDPLTRLISSNHHPMNRTEEGFAGPGRLRRICY